MSDVVCGLLIGLGVSSVLARALLAGETRRLAEENAKLRDILKSAPAAGSGVYLVVRPEITRLLDAERN